MKYALFEAIQENSATHGYKNFQAEVVTLFARFALPAPACAYTILCSLPIHTAIFGALLCEAEHHQVAYRVHYFQDDPVVFDSHPSSAPHK